jgi:hypothetical protein
MSNLIESLPRPAMFCSRDNRPILRRIGLCMGSSPFADNRCLTNR